MGLLGLFDPFGLLGLFGLLGQGLLGLFGLFTGVFIESAGSLAVRVGAPSAGVCGSDSDLSSLPLPLPRPPRGLFPGVGLPGEPLAGDDLLRPTIGAGLDGESFGGWVDSLWEVATLDSSPEKMKMFIVRNKISNQVVF